MTHKHNKKTDCAIVAIDLAKSSFQVHGADIEGRQVFSKKLSRESLKELMVNMPLCLVAMESCATAHYWGRLFESYGHEVRLIAPQFVKPFVKSNKNDAADAAAICTAVRQPDMRFVKIKTQEQEDSQTLHRLRSQVVKHRTALINQIRGLLLERGMVIGRGRAQLNKHLPRLLDTDDMALTQRFRGLLTDLRDDLQALDQRIDGYDRLIATEAQQDERAQRLQQIPGIGPQSATAMLASFGDLGDFRSGREVAACMGLVPRQHSTGGKDRLGGISKRGDRYVRSLMIHGARAVLRHVAKKKDRTSRWAYELISV